MTPKQDTPLTPKELDALEAKYKRYDFTEAGRAVLRLIKSYREVKERADAGG